MLSKIINEQTKQVELGYEEYRNYYISKGFIEQNVEQAYDGSWYLQGFSPVAPQLSNIEIKARRAKEYIIAIDPITAEISRLKDEETTAENQIKINELAQLRKSKVEEIKNQHPYNS